MEYREPERCHLFLYVPFFIPPSFSKSSIVEDDSMQRASFCRIFFSGLLVGFRSKSYENLRFCLFQLYVEAVNKMHCYQFYRSYLLYHIQSHHL